MTPLSGESNLEPWSSLDRSGGVLPEAAGREKYFVLIGVERMQRTEAGANFTVFKCAECH